MGRAVVNPAARNVPHVRYEWPAMPKPKQKIIIVIIVAVVILTGLSIPMLDRARRSARRLSCLHNLQSIGIALKMYSSSTNWGVMPPSFRELYDNGEGVVGDPRVFQCPESKQGYRFVGNHTNSASASAIVAWCAKDSHPKGRNVLYADAHGKFTSDEQFAEELDRLKKKYKDDLDIQDPWLPKDLKDP